MTLPPHDLLLTIRISELRRIVFETSVAYARVLQEGHSVQEAESERAAVLAEALQR